MRVVLLVVLFLSITTNVMSQSPLWQGKGRIAISSDGNEHDHDDWAATPLSLALLSAKGLQNKLVLYTYSDHVWGSNLQMPVGKGGLTAYEQMRESALGGAKMFGFKKSNFICAVDDAEKAYQAMASVINESSEDNPLFIIAAGPMQVIGEGIRRSDFAKRKFVTVISHSNWNDKHAANSYDWEPEHKGWIFKMMQEDFGGEKGGAVQFVKIANQNGGKDYLGLNCSREHFNWMKTSSARENKIYKKGAWDWLYSRQETCIKKGGKNFDPSDAGMLIYLFTGIEKTNPEMAKEIMENPVPKIK
jgi:hypothetical protein